MLSWVNVWVITERLGDAMVRSMTEGDMLGKGEICNGPVIEDGGVKVFEETSRVLCRLCQSFYPPKGMVSIKIPDK